LISIYKISNFYYSFLNTYVKIEKNKSIKYLPLARESLLDMIEMRKNKKCNILLKLIVSVLMCSKVNMQDNILSQCNNKRMSICECRTANTCRMAVNNYVFWQWILLMPYMRIRASVANEHRKWHDETGLQLVMMLLHGKKDIRKVTLVKTSKLLKSPRHILSVKIFAGMLIKFFLRALNISRC